MITVPEAVSKIVSRSRYLSEAISKDIINFSSLARYIKPETEEMLLKTVSQASLIMALRRLKSDLKPHVNYKIIFKKNTQPEMVMRSNLIVIYLNHSKSLDTKYQKLLELNSEPQKYFFSLTKGSLETTIIASKLLEQKMRRILEGEDIISYFQNLSSITIYLPKEAIVTPGIYYFFLKSLAWEGINIIEVISTYFEFTLIFNTKEVNRAFEILKSLFEYK